MSQRLIGGRQRRILGITSSGIVIPVIKGAEPDPEDDDQDLPEGGSRVVTGTEGGDPGAEGDGSTPPGKVYTEDDIQAVLQRMKAADRAKSDAETKVKEFERKNLGELEKANAELADATARADAAEKALLETRIHNKFLSSNKYTWHDPETALKLLDLDDIEVDETGKVHGLEKAIEALAKAKPFLVSKDDKSSGSGGNGGRPSGSQPPANQSGKERDKDRAAMMKKYPQLNR